VEEDLVGAIEQQESNTAAGTEATTKPSRDLVTAYLEARVLLCQRRVHERARLSILDRFHKTNVASEQRHRVLMICAQEPLAKEIAVLPHGSLSHAMAATKRQMDMLSHTHEDIVKRGRTLGSEIASHESRINTHVARHGFMSKDEQHRALAVMRDLIDIKGGHLSSVDL
jgi:hypothetical protein